MLSETSSFLIFTISSNPFITGILYTTPILVLKGKNFAFQYQLEKFDNLLEQKSCQTKPKLEHYTSKFHLLSKNQIISMAYSA